MPLAWNAWALPALIAATVAAAMAVVIYATRPWRAQNRLLALALLLGALSAGPYFGLRMLVIDPESAWRVAAIGVTVLIASPIPYFLFLGTLETPLVAPLRRRSVQAALIAAVLGLEALWLLRPDLVLPAVTPFQHIAGWNVVGGPLLFPVALLPLLAAELFGLIAAISAYRHARNPMQRAQARAYAIAFGTRDLLGAAFIVLFGVFRWNTTPLGEPLFTVGIAAIDGLFFLLLGYAILQHQLFDIDLKLKWGLGRGTLIAILGLVFFLVKEGIESILPIEGLVPSLLGAAAIGLLALPAWRLAIRFAERVMPHVQDTEAYRSERKKEVYRAALEEAMIDGDLSDQDRRVLAKLAQRLGLPEERRGALAA